MAVGPGSGFPGPGAISPGTGTNRAGHQSCLIGLVFLAVSGVFPVLLRTIVDAWRKIKLKVWPRVPDPFEGMCAPGTHHWRGRAEHTPDLHEWVCWCDVCGCMYDPREGD